ADHARGDAAPAAETAAAAIATVTAAARAAIAAAARGRRGWRRRRGRAADADRPHLLRARALRDDGGYENCETDEGGARDAHSRLLFSLPRGRDEADDLVRLQFLDQRVEIARGEGRVADANLVQAAGGRARDHVE